MGDSDLFVANNRIPKLFLAKSSKPVGCLLFQTRFAIYVNSSSFIGYYLFKKRGRFGKP